MHCQSVGSLKTQNTGIILTDRKKYRGFVIDPIIRWENDIETQNDDISVEEQVVYVLDPIHRYRIDNWRLRGSRNLELGEQHRLSS